MNSEEYVRLPSTSNSSGLTKLDVKAPREHLYIVFSEPFSILFISSDSQGLSSVSNRDWK